MSEQPRDWDREMADIDRAIAKQGSVPPSAPAPAAPVGRVVPAAGASPVRRRSVALTWFWVVLAVALAVALGIWPYRRECGLQLFFYLGAAGLTVVVGVLAALASWSHRRGFAHVVALLTLLWAGVAATREILPRTGYAKLDRTWTCVASPAAGVTSGQGTSAPSPSGPSPGTPRTGTPSGSAPSAGAPSAGAPSGSAPSGTAPSGSAPSGTAPSGSAPSGTAPSGSAQPGSGTELQSTTTPSEAPSAGSSTPAPQP